jgi:hypothetical protein
MAANSSTYDASGHPLSADKAADNIAHVFANTRTVPASGSTTPGSTAPGSTAPSSTTLEPLGVDINANIELDGLRGKHVMLYWSMWQQGGNTRLFGQWLSTYAGFELTATTDKDTGSIDFWLPLPKAHGQYFVRLELRLKDGPQLTSEDSNVFD